MSYTSIIVNSGTATVGTPIGITVPTTLDDIQKDKKYVLQFKARPLNEKQLLDNIYVGNQKLSDVYMTEFEVVTIEEVDFYDCYIVFTAQSNMDNPSVTIGRIKADTDSNSLDVFELTELGLYQGEENKRYSPSSSDIQIIKKELMTMIHQLANCITLKAERKEIDVLTDKISEALGQIQVSAGEIELKVSNDNIISSINMTPESIKINTNLLDLTGDLDLQGTFKCYKSNSNKESNYLDMSGAMMFGYNDVGGKYPVFASGLWTDENMGYFSVGYTRADVSDTNGCLWISPQQGNTGCQLTYSRLLSNGGVGSTNLYFQQNGILNFMTSINGENETDDYYCYNFDAGVSTKALRCKNLRTENIYPRYSNTYDLGAPSASFKDGYFNTISTTEETLKLGTCTSDGDWKVKGNITINSSAGYIYPSQDIGFDLGTPTNRFKDTYCDSVCTTNTELRLGTVDGSASWRTYGPLIINSKTGYVHPVSNGNLSLGTTGIRFHSINLVNSPNVSSDMRVKTDIHYLNNQDESKIINGRSTINMDITTKDMHDFIKNDLQLASYRYNNNIDRGNTSVDYGFIAQDILYTKVGSEIVQLEDKYDLDSGLSYNQNNYISTIAGALQEEIKIRDEQIASLEDRIAKLEKLVENLIEK